MQGENRVHGELDGLARAVGAKVKQLFAHDAENWLGLFQRCGIAANHENEFAFFGAPIAASDGCVEKAHAAFGAGSDDFTRKGRRHGAGIHVNAAALERLHGAAVAPENLFERRGIANHGEKKIGSGGNFLRRFGELGSGSDEFVSARSGAVPNGERVAGFDEVHAHGAAHEAESDKADVLCRGIQENLLDDGRLQALAIAQQKKTIVADVRM